MRSPEAVKKLVWCCFTSFRRRPESSAFYWVTNNLDPGFHRGDEYSAVLFIASLQPGEGSFGTLSFSMSNSQHSSSIAEEAPPCYISL
jgi:hypothetical protein